MSTHLLKCFGFNVNEAQPVPAVVVVVEAVASMATSEVVVDVAADVDADDEQSKAES